MRLNRKYIFFVILICAISLGLGISFSNKQKNSIAQDKATKTNYEQGIEELILSDYYDKEGDEDYKSIVDNYKENIERYKNFGGNSEELEDIKETLDSQKEKIIKSNREIILNKSQELEGLKESLYSYEIENIEGTQSKIDDLSSEKKYNSAYKELETTVASFSNINLDANIHISRYDYSQFPKVRVYFDSNSLETTLGHSIDGTKFNVIEKIGNKYKDIKIAQQGSVDGNLNIDIVADISDSMTPYLYDVQTATTNFVNNIDTNKNRVALLSFSDYVTRESEFTNDKNQILGRINNLKTAGMTAFYDSLCVSISKTSEQMGAKCIVAFTDGYDNKSRNTKDVVINLSKKYDIPIYIIGIGELGVYEQELKDLATQTNGIYSNVNQADLNLQMSQIYNQILENQKSLYYIDYIDEIEDKSVSRELYLRYNDNIIIRQQLNESVVDNTPSAANNQSVEEAEVANFIRESNIKYFRALNSGNEYDITDLKSCYLQGAKDNEGYSLEESIDRHVSDHYTYQFFDYSIDEVIKEGDYYKVTYTQKYIQNTGTKETLYQSSATDLVKKVNGRFYISGYVGGSTEILNSIGERTGESIRN